MSFLEAKQIIQSLRSVIRTILQPLQHSIVQCSWNLAWATVLGYVAWTLVYLNLAWEPVLGSLAWEPVLGSLFLGTCLLGALPDNLFLGTFSWEPVLGNFACLLQTCSLGPCSGTCFS